MATADPKAERTAKLVEVLRRQRDTNEEYPLGAARLREMAEPEASDEDLFAALAHKSLAVGAKKDLSAPVALTEDAGRLAASDQLLEYALGKLASAEKPLHRVDRVVGKVDKALQAAFEAAVNERLAADNLPARVGKATVKDAPHLYLHQFPPPVPKKSPALELAEQLAAARHARPEVVVSLADLCPPDTPPGLLKKALAEEAFAGRAVVVPVGKSLALVGSADAAEALLGSDRLLTALLESRTSPKKPFATPDDLAAALPEAHRGALAGSLRERLTANRLPAGVLRREEEGQTVLCLESHLPAGLVLGEKVVAGLQRRREAGQGYPASLAAVLAAESPDTPADVVERLAADKGLRTRVVLAVPGRADSPAALPGDEERLACSPLLLEYVVGLASTPEQPLHALRKVAGRLDAALRPAFEQAAAIAVSERTLPATLAAHDVKGQPHLRRGDYPLPPPADEALATRLLAALKRGRAEGAYPASLRDLLPPETPEKLTKAALAHAAFAGHAVVGLPGDLGSLAALKEDHLRLAADPRLLEQALSKARSPENQAIAVADVCKTVATDLRPEFTVAVGRLLAAAELPATVACLLIKKKPHLVLKADLAARPVIIAAAAEPEVPVRESFDAEMSRLEVGRDARPVEDPAPAEQGDLFAATADGE